jgi:hypothetical protein
MTRPLPATLDIFAPEVAWIDSRVMGDLVNALKFEIQILTMKLETSEGRLRASEYKLKQALDERRAA